MNQRNLTETMPPEEEQIVRWAYERGHNLGNRNWLGDAGNEEKYGRTITFPFIPIGVLEYSFIVFPRSSKGVSIASPEDLKAYLKSGKQYFSEFLCAIADGTPCNPGDLALNIAKRASNLVYFVLSNDGELEELERRGTDFMIPAGTNQERISYLLGKIDSLVM